MESLLFSVGANTATGFSTAGCTNPAGATGCLMSLNLTALGNAWPPTAPTYGYPLPTVATGAASSGILVDRVTMPHAFTTLGGSGLATTVGFSTTVGVSTTVATLSTGMGGRKASAGQLTVTVTSGTGTKFEPGEYVRVSSTGGASIAEDKQIAGVTANSLTFTSALATSHSKNATITSSVTG